MRENFNNGWVAKADGQTLQAVRIDGWQQGFVVPAGIDGTISLSFTPQRLVVLGLVLGVLGVLALGALLVLPGSSASASVGERIIDPRLGLIVALTAAVLLAGVVGLVAVATALYMLRRVERHVRAVEVLVVAGLIGASSVVVALASSPLEQSNSAIVQVACAMAIGVVVAAAFKPDRDESRRERKQMETVHVSPIGGLDDAQATPVAPRS